ncbi:MAG: FKBP-type peptidyl-prolyl cis-trans isomerase [Planctomycetaceae bacterium]
MSRWLSLLTVSIAALNLAGCLPPVQEVQDSNPVSSKPLEKTAAEETPSQSPESNPVTEATMKEGFTQAPSGLKYKLVREGGKKPTAADTVRVNYKGWLDDGTIFDQSYGREPAEFPLRGVIPGWTEGLQFVGEGGEIELEIPSHLGYGPGGQGPIPPGATLHFKVELLKIL